MTSPYLDAVNDPPAVLPGNVFADPDGDAGVDAAVVDAHDGAGGGLDQEEGEEEREVHLEEEEELLSRKTQPDTMATSTLTHSLSRSLRLPEEKCSWKPVF